MSTTAHLPLPSPSLAQAAKSFYAGVLAVGQVIMNARDMVSDVRRLQALHNEADRCEGYAPTRAAALRAEASKILAD